MFSKNYVVIKIRYLYYYFLYFFILFYKRFFGKEEKKIEEGVTNKINIFVDNQKKRFLETFEETEYQNYLYSSNIDECFYDKEKYNEMIENIDNEIEKKWKTKLMFKNTPYGNVIMCYDVYKNGFAYYSDVNLNYSILNALAMNYVITYYCRDFFIDEKTLPEDKRDMKIFKMIQEIEKENEKSKKNNKKGKEEDFKSVYRKSIEEQKKKTDLPFIKAKKNDNLPKEKVYQTNKFIYLGKIVNFSFLKNEVKTQKKNILTKGSLINENKSENIDVININLQNTEAMSWKQFKKMNLENKEKTDNK